MLGFNLMFACPSASFTVELGMYLEVDQNSVNAAVIGINNVMKSLGMLEGPLEKISNIPVIPSDNYVRYVSHPRTNVPAIIDLQINNHA